jgi:trans-2,3-dihydro-3-hydroxyanthranilate isomerase
MRYKFYTCDVFTDIRFGGNPLAVVLDAEGLSNEQMQLIAREFNYSETTFVLPAESGHTNKVRIFHRKSEIPFAGHPNIGTAFTLATIGALGEFGHVTEIAFEEKAGLVPITIRKDEGKPIWCELKAPEGLFLGKTIAVEQIASILSLTANDIITKTHQPQVASVGLPFVITELKDRSCLEQVKINVNVLAELEAQGIRPSVFTYVHSHGDFDIRARMFAPLAGTLEDPATGSANCALVGMLTHYQSAESGTFRWRIAQGVEMNRASVLEARTEKQAGSVTGVWIAGSSVMVSEGTLEVD